MKARKSFWKSTLGLAASYGIIFLEVRNKYYAEHKGDKKKSLSAFDTMKMLTALKKEVTWLNEVNSQSLQHSLVQLDKAFKSFFKRNAAYPRFKSKKDKKTVFHSTIGIQGSREYAGHPQIH